MLSSRIYNTFGERGSGNQKNKIWERGIKRGGPERGDKYFSRSELNTSNETTGGKGENRQDMQAFEGSQTS